ncbi:hypothetical protein C8A03DRAFT_44639 [Achaetomium macrosporum]|uniref:Mid2 domain-containing protein n=1 Tax=Achaetomium macrosporum TaxID=79813 RepID=A0AAN7H6L4_9PEZI|nr:hypothetical protein C8A03DRAFT_44639 [Achaetomium macrosporum]
MPGRGLTLWVASLAAVRTAASAVLMNDLFMRQSSCAPNFNQCKNADFPPYFCCGSGEDCIVLAGNTTVLCCPSGAGCQRLQPIPCDISLQDGEKYPDAVVKTTALGGTLGRCGNQCCPFGYSCRNNECIMDRDQNAVPIQINTAKPNPTSTAGSRTSATTDARSSQTPDSTNAADDSSSDQASGSNGGPPIAAIAGGVAAGAVVLIGAAVLAFILLRKRKNASESGNPSKFSRSTSSFGNLISNPIVAENTTLRSDFARVSPRNTSEDPASVTAALIDSSVNSPESGAGVLAVPPAAAQKAERQSSAPYGSFEPSAYVDMPYVDQDNGLMPHTPRQNREPSSVSINVFADPNITPDRTPESNTDRRYTNMTTFTQMLDSVGLDGVARGESYLPYQPESEQGTPMPKR